MGAALAGNDIILSEDGNDVLAGDALASGLGGTATADNIAAVVGSGDGDINFLAPLVPGLPSDLQIPALIGIGLLDLVNPSVAMAGTDVIFGGLGGDGDLLVGDALRSHDVGGDATANNEERKSKPLNTSN